MQSEQPTGLRRPRWPTRGRQVAGTLWLLVGLTGVGSAHAAGITIGPADSPASLTGLTFDLDCDDLVVNGTLDATGATFQKVGNVIIGAGGSLTATNASIAVAHSWQNIGTFSGAGSTVSASNACSNSSTAFSGNTTFHNLSATTPGLVLNMAAGSEQKVGGLLTLAGVTLLGQGGTAYLSLLPGGTQNISGVGVNGVSAVRGQRLAPTQTNQISGSAANWFNSPPDVGLAPIPTIGHFGLAFMGLLLGAATFLQRRWGSRGRH